MTKFAMRRSVSLTFKGAQSGLCGSHAQHATRISQRLASIQYDVLFAPMGATWIAFLNIDKPIVYMSDATFRLINGYYDPAYSLTGKDFAERDEIEQRALERASVVVVTSNWAARSVINDYSINPDKVRVIFSGPNLSAPPARESLESVPDLNEYRFLMVGRSWWRKGGDIGLEAIDAVVEKGHKAHLTICGMAPPGPYNQSLVTVIPHLDKSHTDDYMTLCNLYRESHFLLFPSRAECHGLSMNEANAFGVPVLANTTGGIPDYITPDVNGYLFSHEARGSMYADKALEVLSDRHRYEKLRKATRDEYEGRLNWSVWARSINRELSLLLGS
ncbi:MAG: glycosyltransferase family 4 protein [Gammaproteobacteria bacterium]|nr:glycosyltransferase family 4 protein [Gammaproteobacteria bacterium]